MRLSQSLILVTLVLATCGVFTFPAWEMLLRAVGVSREGLEAGGTWHRPFSANDLSNLATIRALVEQGTWAIDDTGFTTSDQALIDGHYYSVRPPVLPFLAAGVYWVLYHGLGWQLTPDGGFGACHWVLVMVFSGGSLALTAAIVGEWTSGAPSRRPGRRLGTPTPETRHPKARHAYSIAKPQAALLFAWGSLALPYAVVLNHHIVAACLISVAATLLLRGQQDGMLGPLQAATAGGCAGLAATIDLAGGGIFLLGFLGWVLAVPVLRRRFFWGAISVLAAGVLHGVLNWQITGDVIPVLVRPEYIAFPGATLKRSQLSGFFHHQSPAEFFTYLGGLLLASPEDGFSPRGLFVYTPAAFFAALAGARIVWGGGSERASGRVGERGDSRLSRKRPPRGLVDSNSRLSTLNSQLSTSSHPLRWSAVFLGSASIAYVLYLALFTNNYSGGCYGVRWFVLLLPVVYLLLFGGWELLSRWEQICAAAALIAAIPLAWWGLVFGTWQGLQVFPLVFHYTWAMPVLFVAAMLPRVLGRWVCGRAPA